MKRFFAALAFLAALALPAHAQTGSAKTTAQLIVEINGNFSDNTVGAITPAIARQSYLDMIASSANLLSSNVFTAQNIFTGVQTATAAALQFGLSGGCQATWLFTYTDPCGAYMIGYGPIGTGAVAFANRSSDYSAATPYSLDLITNQVYAVHDNTANTGYFGIWANYWLVQRTATAYANPNLFALEASFVNRGANVQADPFNDPSGLNVIMRLDSGVGATGPNIVTGAIEVAYNGATFYSALKVNVNALAPSASGFYEAVQLTSAPTGSVGPGHSIVWYSAAYPNISGVIEVDTTGFLDLHGINGIHSGDAFTALINTAPSASAKAPYCFSSTANFCLFYGTGVPTATAAQSSLYLRNDGFVYFNTNGTTGWDQVVGAAATQTLTNKTIGAGQLSGQVAVANGGTNCAVASITCFNNITGLTAAGTTGATSTNLVFSSGPTFAGTVTGPDAGTWGAGGINSSIIGGTTPAAITGTTIRANSGFSANGTAGLASKTCSITTANVTTGITITITEGLVTATTTC